MKTSFTVIMDFTSLIIYFAIFNYFGEIPITLNQNGIKHNVCLYILSYMAACPNHFLCNCYVNI